MEPDWIYGLAGGTLIGLSAALLLLSRGRIAGISGIVGTLIATRPTSESGLQLLFVLGLIAGPLIVWLAQGRPVVEIETSLPVLIAGGLLVGFGTRMGGGCTSGHGVCGLSRLSPRSVVATGIFMAVGALTVAIVRHVV